MKAVVAAFNQEKALVGAFSVITNLRMELFEALIPGPPGRAQHLGQGAHQGRGPGHELLPGLPQGQCGRLEGGELQAGWPGQKCGHQE